MHEKTSAPEIVALSCGAVSGLAAWLTICANAVGKSEFASAIGYFGYIPTFAAIAVALPFVYLRRKYFQKVQETPSLYSYAFIGKSNLPKVCAKLCEFLMLYFVGWMFSACTILWAVS